MKSVLASFAILILSASFLSCKQNSSTTDLKSGKSENVMSKPPEASLSVAQLQQQIDKEIREILTTASDSMVKEAAVVVEETRKAIRDLVDSNFDAASKDIETAIGKAEVIIAAKPNLGLVPLTVEVKIHDLVADMQTVKQIRDDVEDLTDKGYLQAARRLLDGLSSELTITTTSLPLATYPDALREAMRLTKEKKALEAALILNSALNTIIIEERAVPLPLIRAERMLAEVDSLVHSNSAKTDDINLLLDNADYQIRFAEVLGYGKKDKEFGELYDAIKELKAEVKKHGSNSQKLITNLRDKLNKFKKRISSPAK